MIPEWGLFCLILAWGLALCATSFPFIARTSQNPLWQAMIRPAVYGQTFFISMSFVTLVYSFYRDDFSLAYVAQNAYSDLPLLYKLCAVWGAHEGSLLLWSLILAGWTFLLAINLQKIQETLLNVILSVLSAIQVGFLFLLLETSHPFVRLLPFPAKEGMDLNPLLQDPGFVFHPPFLYIGYVGFAVPFAFAITALIKKEASQFALARPWALLAWAFLTIGIALGSWWAYYELGWGGWWFWDPVENASFMPWLTGGALAHALLGVEKRKLFYSWGILLAIATFLLSLIGTFLVRSGVLSSVHAFATDPGRGIYILSFLGITFMVAFTLYVCRVQQVLQTQGTFSFGSKASWLLLGNIILFVAALTILLGTLYPLVIEVLLHEKLSVGPPYFNSVFIPIMIPLLCLMPLVPHLQWDKDALHVLVQKNKRKMIIFCLSLLAFSVAVKQYLSLLAIMGVALGLWIISGTLLKCYVNKRKNVPYMGVGLAHIGLAMAVMGMTLTTALETEKELEMDVGEAVHIKGVDFVFEGIKEVRGPNYQAQQGHFIIARDGKIMIHLFPEKRFFIARELVMTETAIWPSFLCDFYIALGERGKAGKWSVRLYIKPFIRWIWIGAGLIALGAGLSAIMALRQNRVKRNETVSL